jgi:hypothetical protein
VPTLFLPGACGDVNPVYSVAGDILGEKLGGGIMQCLGHVELITNPSLAIESREIQMPGREHPEFKEAEIARNWPRHRHCSKETGPLSHAARASWSVRVVSARPSP